MCERTHFDQAGLEQDEHAWDDHFKDSGFKDGGGAAGPKSAGASPRDNDAVARAEHMLACLAVDFCDSMLREIDRLRLICARCRIFLRTQQPARVNLAADEMLRACTDIRDVAATFGFELCTQIAGALCQLLDDSMETSLHVIKAAEGHLDLMEEQFQSGMDNDNEVLAQEISQRLASLSAMASRTAPAMRGNMNGDEILIANSPQ